MILAASPSCDPALTSLFTPLRPDVGRYEVCTTTESLEDVAAEASDARFGPLELLEPADAFGSTGSYSRAALAQLYGGRRVRVTRGWRERDGRFESITLLSPHPDAALTHLLPGVMVITWTRNATR
jgi:hypothetical protein